MGTIGNIFPHFGTPSLLRKDLTGWTGYRNMGECIEQDIAALIFLLKKSSGQ